MHGSALSNARWIAVSRVVSIGVQLLGLLWLSRLLSPADYGLVAMATVVTNLANLVRDMGTTQALIQREGLNEETILTAFWFTVAIGGVLGVVVALLAPLVALAFEAPGVTGIVLLLAVSFPVLGSTTVHQALLERDSRFPLLARVEVVAGVSGLTVGVIAAHLGAGAYSLALNSVVYAIVSSTQLWLASPVKPRWLWNRHELRGIRQFSDYLVGFNLIVYLYTNAPSMIIGRFLGPESLGLYSLASKIVDFPVTNLTFVASRALFPVMSRQQEAPEEMAALYLRSLTLVAFVVAPMMAGLVVLREPFIEVALSSKWLPMADVLRWLAAVGFVHSLTCTTGSLLMARGRTDLLFYLSIAHVILAVPAFIIGLRWGVAGVAAGHLVAAVIDAILCFYVVLRVLGKNIGTFLQSILTPIALTTVMVVVVVLCQGMLTVNDMSALAHLVGLVIVGAATYGILAWVFVRPSLQDVFRFFRR